MADMFPQYVPPPNQADKRADILGVDTVPTQPKYVVAESMADWRYVPPNCEWVLEVNRTDCRFEL
jgi:hypothetical protein